MYEYVKLCKQEYTACLLSNKVMVLAVLILFGQTE